MLLELILLALGRGVGRGVEVGADVDAVVHEVLYLVHQLGLVGEVLAVDGVAHAVFEAAADEVVHAVAVYVGDDGHAVVAELGLVIALVVHLVELDEARGGEATVPGVEQLCDIAVESAEQQVVEAVAVEVVDLRGYPVPFHAEDAYLHELRGVEPALVAVEHQQLALVGAADEVAVAVAVQVAVVGHDLPGEAGVHQSAHGLEFEVAQAAEEIYLAVARAADDVGFAVAVVVADYGRGIAGDGELPALCVGQGLGLLGYHAGIVALALVEVEPSVGGAAYEVELAVPVEVVHRRVGAQVVLRVVGKIAAAVVHRDYGEPLVPGGDVRAGGVGVFVVVHGEGELVRALAEQRGHRLGPGEPGVAVAHQGVGRDLRILLAEFRKGYAGAVRKAAELLKVQLPGHGRAAEGAVNARDGIAHRALEIEGGEGVLEQARRAHCRVGEVALSVVALLEHGAADAVGVGQEARGEKDIALAVHVHRGYGEAHARAERHGGGGLEPHPALEALELRKVRVRLVELVEVAGDVLQLLQVVADIGVLHVVGIVLELVEALGADEVLVEEVVEVVGEEHAAAVFGKGGYLVAQRLCVGGGHDALVRVEYVVALEGVVAGDVHGVALEAEQQRLAEAGVGVLPVSGTRTAVIEHGGVQVVFVRVQGAERYLGCGQLVLLYVVAPAAYEGDIYLSTAGQHP